MGNLMNAINASASALFPVAVGPRIATTTGFIARVRRRRG